MAATCALLVGACEFLDPNPGPAAADATGGNVEPIPDTFGTPTAAKGKVVYDTNCARCHGADAGGTEIWPAPIWGEVGFEALVMSGRSAMPAFPALNEPRIEAIELYLATLLPNLNDQTAGSVLFATYCEGCHGAEGGGGPEFPGSIQGYDSVTDLVRQGRGDMPGFSPAQLSDANIDSIQVYLSGLLDLSALSGQQYFEVRCAGCHGFDAAGTGRGYGIRLPVQAYAAYVVRNGRPGLTFPGAMPEYSESILSNAQLADLLGYLNSFPKPTTGQEIYNTYCSNCHGLDGQGGVVGSNIWESRDEFSKFQERIRDGEGGNNYGDRTGYMPAWAEQQISDAEIQLILDYLNTISG